MPKPYEAFFVESGSAILAVATVANLLRQTVLLFSGKFFIGGGGRIRTSEVYDVRFTV